MIYCQRGFLARLYHAIWGRYVYPWLLLRELDALDAAGLAAIRANQALEANGSVLIVGAGLGHDVVHYQRNPKVTGITLLEPYKPLLERLLLRFGVTCPEVEVREGWGEALPFEAGSFRTVVLSFVLCTTRDPAGVLREAYRVLMPGGKLIFREHVRSRSHWVGLLQDILQPFWYLLSNGCHCNRETSVVIGRSPFHSAVDLGDVPGASWFVRPMISGVTIKPVRSTAALVAELVREPVHA